MARGRAATDRRPSRRRSLGGEFEVDQPGRWEYTIQAWTDVFGTWRDELERKVAAGQDDLQGELSEGIVLLRRAGESAAGAPAGS